ncbi:hypothetical protein BD310DRAFT_914929 [Dichomitus squalens]|uniref:Uncharacterized protein n=1 Tax=Dichomitus squalens TaxID=114155 RepID=A0A4Q9QBQ7_9APHY|nr:hypothetical protein BD310DRAFT_919344 [Dichomitus squalens]TBU64596.1 hypothetical protein BD310DRAFT_914929 [Dichomitus squalens]
MWRPAVDDHAVARATDHEPLAWRALVHTYCRAPCERCMISLLRMPLPMMPAPLEITRYNL